MSGIAIGLFIGAYLNNPALRRTVDTAVKKAVGMGIDALNGKPLLIDPQQETAEEE
ncbi:MAG: hypothetical protein FWC77_01665 [Defluviitaleaceae bacterium]|nr:hypothetical protein [Defluviitaleaceae bacterium]